MSLRERLGHDELLRAWHMGLDARFCDCLVREMDKAELIATVGLLLEQRDAAQQRENVRIAKYNAELRGSKTPPIPPANQAEVSE